MSCPVQSREGGSWRSEPTHTSPRNGVDDETAGRHFESHSQAAELDRSSRDRRDERAHHAAQARGLSGIRLHGAVRPAPWEKKHPPCTDGNGGKSIGSVSGAVL